MLSPNEKYEMVSKNTLTLILLANVLEKKRSFNEKQYFMYKKLNKNTLYFCLMVFKSYFNIIDKVKICYLLAASFTYFWAHLKAKNTFKKIYKIVKVRWKCTKKT